MNGQPIVIGGIPLPSGDPLFLAVVSVHVVAGLGCVIAGAFAMLSRKGPGRHPRAGTIYCWNLAVVFVSMATIAVWRWAEDSMLFALGAASFLAAAFGRSARRRLLPGWPRLHMTGMGLSYILLLTAFYVDNGKNLPLWRLAPQWAFWVLPSAIGLPVLVWGLLFHRIVRKQIQGKARPAL
jgi:hypothetical protein